MAACCDSSADSAGSDRYADGSLFLSTIEQRHGVRQKTCLPAIYLFASFTQLTPRENTTDANLRQN